MLKDSRRVGGAIPHLERLDQLIAVCTDLACDHLDELAVSRNNHPGLRAPGPRRGAEMRREDIANEIFLQIIQFTVSPSQPFNDIIGVEME